MSAVILEFPQRHVFDAGQVARLIELVQDSPDHEQALHDIAIILADEPRGAALVDLVRRKIGAAPIENCREVQQRLYEIKAIAELLAEKALSEPEHEDDPMWNSLSLIVNLAQAGLGHLDRVPRA